MSGPTETVNDRRIVGNDTAETIEDNDDDTLIVARGGNDRIFGGDGNDRIFGGDGNDTIDGGAGNDSMDGGAGNDTIWGDAGDDRMTGGDGADIFVFNDGHGNDTITDFDVDQDVLEFSRFGIDSVEELSITQSGENVVIDLTGHDGGQITLIGVSVEDLGAEQFEFDGPVENQRLFGTLNADTINAGEGNDRVGGGYGNDTIDGEGGNDVLYGNSGDDLVTGGEGNDQLGGGEGNDTLDGEEGDDRLSGNAGDDVLTGGTGADTFSFEDAQGNDTITDFDIDEDLIDLVKLPGVDSFDDLTITQAGNDAVIDLTEYGAGQITFQNVDISELTADQFSFLEHLHITPTEGSLWMYEEAGNDTLEGDDNENKMMGRKGDDTLEGKGGDDIYYGGEGADTFVIGLNAGNDVITDLHKGVDKIDLTAFTGISSLDDVVITETGLFTFQIDLSEHKGGTIMLHSHGDGIDMDELDASDFIFYDDGA